MVLVVFATNIRPSELVDEAFLRRIHYKVFAESPTIADFKRIFSNVLRANATSPTTSGLVDGLLRPLPSAPKHRASRLPSARSDRSGAGPGRLPRRAARLTPELLEAACASYFVDDTENAPVFV